MEYVLEISSLPKWPDAAGRKIEKQIITFFNFPVEKVLTRNVYTLVSDVSKDEATRIVSELSDPVMQRGRIRTRMDSELTSDWVIVVGFRPGVTDNVARTARVAISDIIGRKLASEEKVFSSIEYLIYGEELNRADVQAIATRLLANKLIQNVTICSKEEVEKTGIPLNTPFVDTHDKVIVNEVDLDVSDDRLLEISKDGILALTLEEMKTIKNYFMNAEGRGNYDLKNMPTDVELECIAQTWSEHCKHKIFDAAISYEDENGEIEEITSCYSSFIKKSTREIGKEVDWLVSVFSDNAGVISFNDKLDLVYKVETHNSPSALDPYGGAMTGIVGVNRDPMGTGLGANLLINTWGYCFGSPYTPKESVPEGLLHPRRIREGVHQGVIDGGNQSGIPYGVGWEYFDDRYIGKPLVFCGTVGTLPKKVGNNDASKKSIKPGDLIVMTGGRIGKDGIHGATFSSEELHKDSPVQAVQIGDPITQKMMSDFIYEARDLALYRFVTDNGAGGLSSSIGEMANECGGCNLDLTDAPLKYSGLQPWEILISEAQERMSFAVPKENIEEFIKLANGRDVEVSVLGEFNDSGKVQVTYQDKTVACIDIEFLHNGAPRMQLKAKWTPPVWEEPSKEHIASRDLGEDILNMLERLNICSNEQMARQYDHEVKGLSVVKPYIGVKRDISNDSSVFMAEPLGKEGIVLSYGIQPAYSDIDTYHMMASIIDLAVRRLIAAGGRLDHIAGLDNFCWPDPVQSEGTPDGEYKLAQLVRANKALYDYTKAFKVPCISGKDSMKNDSTRGGRKISIPPTVLFSVIGKIDDVSKAVSTDIKFPGDIVYVIGSTKPELGGSEYFSMLGSIGNSVPKVDVHKVYPIYQAIEKVAQDELANSIAATAIGGLAMTFAKSALGGRLGLDIELGEIPHDGKMSHHELLFSESCGRFVMTVSPENATKVETIFENLPFAAVGKVTSTEKINIEGCSLDLNKLADRYKNKLFF